MVRKGQSLSIDIIIIIVIGLVVLVFVILFFTGTFSKGITGTNNVINPALNQTNQTGQLINNLSNQVNGSLVHQVHLPQQVIPNQPLRLVQQLHLLQAPLLYSKYKI
ncbi:MAG: hypothetical protein GU343_01585 [Nanoarchaeota archaeon]|jgi:flagellar basal body-associated protein FliL|nr:hypothetical protein [Nanoarchaeota archaeon]